MHWHRRSSNPVQNKELVARNHGLFKQAFVVCCEQKNIIVEKAVDSIEASNYFCSLSK